MDHTTWLQLLKIVRPGTQLRNIPDDLMPTLIYYCVPIELSQILEFKSLLNDINECKQAHTKSGMFQYLGCSNCRYGKPVMKLGDRLFCEYCAKNNYFEYDRGSHKWMISKHIELYDDNNCEIMHEFQNIQITNEYNTTSIKDAGHDLDIRGFRKKILPDDSSKPYYEYPRTLAFEEQSCLLCINNRNINRCVMCGGAKNFRKLYHWSNYNYQSKLIMLHICVDCIPKTEKYLAFDKKITHIALTK